MRSSLRLFVLFLLVGLGLAVSAGSGDPESPATRASHPKTGVRILPIELGKNGAPSAFENLEGFEVHLVPHDGPGEELVYPCGPRFQPPPGRYRFWIQGEWRMSPYSLLLGYSGSSGGSGVTSGVPVGDAGRVVLPAGQKEGDPPERPARDTVLELLHAGSYLEGQFPRWEISRRRGTREIGKGVLLPAGKAIGALWDRGRRGYVALSRPFEVRGGKTVEVPLERPRGVAHLVVQLERHALASTAYEAGVELALRQGEDEIPPDVEVLTADRVHAVWYGLAPGPAELRAESPQSFLAPRRIELAPGTIERVAAELAPRPALEVELDLPAVLREGPLALELRRLPQGEMIERRAVPPAAGTHRFAALPPALLEVALTTSLGAFTREADLSSGRDGFLVLKPEPVILRGTVYHGDEGYPAELSFTTVARETVTARAGEDGAYEVVLTDPLRSVAIELDGSRAAPYVDFFSAAIAESKTLDFHLPDVEFSVRVLDAATGRGIPGASVAIRNAYPAEEAGEGRRDVETRRERVVSQQARADETGVAWLPPLRRGGLEIRAAADGYLRMREPVEAHVLDGETDQSFEVRLEPLGARVALRLVLPGGAPAAGAEVSLVDSLATGRSLLSTRSDGEGRAELPREPAGLVLVRHPDAGFLVAEWRPRDGEGEVELVLPAAAERPLSVQIKDSSGKSSVPNAELALWVQGRRLSGGTLAWLTGGRPLADASGAWRGANLPRGPVAVLAWGLGMRAEAWAGSLDAQATVVAFPWPEPIEVRALE